MFLKHRNKENELLANNDNIESRVEAIISKINMSMQDYQEEVEQEHERA